jgi:signal transduction histidine kinase
MIPITGLYSKMSINSNSTKELADLITQNQEEISKTWARNVKNMPNSEYQQYSLEEIQSWAKEGLATIIKTLQTGSQQAIYDFVSKLTSGRLQADLPIHIITEAFLLSKDAILPIINETYVGDSYSLFKTATLLDLFVRKMIKQFEKDYSESIHSKLVEESEKRIAEIESLQRTMSALLQKITLDEMLEIVCAEAQRLTLATGSAVLLLEDEGWLQVTIGTGYPSPALNRIPVDDSIAGQAVQEEEPILINKPSNQIQAYHRNPDLESLLVIPLQVEGMTIGVIDVVNKSGGFSEEDIRIMSLFADQAAIAIQNTKLHQKTEQLAVLEERQRLARELHDSVSQSLYSLNLYTDAARLAISKGHTQQAENNLNELRNLIREAMLDMRLLIFELHPPLLEKEGLATALRTRLESVEARSGIKTNFITNEERRLSINTEAELYRIAQEALNNAVKHSKAQNISVNLHFGEDKFRMIIWDNGIGFDTNILEQSGGMGLRGIEARVKRINGKSDITSKQGEGTQLLVEIDI